MPTLYELTQQYAELDALLADTGGDISDPVVEAQLDAILADLAHDRETKVCNYVAFIREKRARAEARIMEAGRLEIAARREQKQADALLRRLQGAFTAAGWSKVETRLGTVSLVKHGGKTPVVISGDVTPEQVQEEFVRVKTTVDFDKDKIREALEGGFDLGWAELGERGTSLRIR